MKKLKTLIQAIRIYSQNIGMEYGTEKCEMLIMIRGKRQMTEIIELPNQEKIRQNARRKGNLQVPGNIGSRQIQIRRDEIKNEKVSQENEKITRN